MVEPIARVRIELLDIEPTVWRRVDVPLSSTLVSFHHVIQVTVGWTNSHLFEFRIANRSYADPFMVDLFDWKVYKASSIRLKTLVDRGIREFTYLYDFGDHWEHIIAIEDLRDGKAEVDYPAFVDGARRCPPEDVGGVTGFEEFLAAAFDPSHVEHEDLTAWYEASYSKRFDPDDIDQPRVQIWLAEFARRRRGPLLRHRAKRLGRDS